MDQLIIDEHMRCYLLNHAHGSSYAKYYIVFSPYAYEN